MQHRMAMKSGFTFIELCLGLVVTMLVMSALAAFSLAMANAWRSAETTQSLTLRGHHAIARIESEIRNARLIGVCRTGSSEGVGDGAAVMLWKSDLNGDGYIQGDECSMIAHDPTLDRIVLYPSGYADGVGTWSHSGTFTNSTVFAQFPTNRPELTLANGIYGAVFQTSGTSGTTFSPSLKFALKIMVNDEQGDRAIVGGGSRLAVEHGTATVRAPLATPGN